MVADFSVAETTPRKSRFGISQHAAGVAGIALNGVQCSNIDHCFPRSS
jgi:hypothetical protein